MLRHSWRTELKAAASENVVVTLVQRYLSEWTPEEIDSAPPGAWPGPLRTSRGVVEHSVKLATLHAAYAGDAAALPSLQQLLLFFTHAAARCVALASLVDLGSQGARKGQKVPEA